MMDLFAIEKKEKLQLKLVDSCQFFLKTKLFLRVIYQVVKRIGREEWEEGSGSAQE